MRKKFGFSGLLFKLGVKELFFFQLVDGLEEFLEPLGDLGFLCLEVVGFGQVSLQVKQLIGALERFALG